VSSCGKRADAGGAAAGELIELLARGELVPEEPVVSVVNEAVAAASGAGGYLFKGFRAVPEDAEDAVLAGTRTFVSAKTLTMVSDAWGPAVAVASTSLSPKIPITVSLDQSAGRLTCRFLKIATWIVASELARRRQRFGRPKPGPTG
jgi:hypothetical protein